MFHGPLLLPFILYIQRNSRGSRGDPYLQGKTAGGVNGVTPGDTPG